MLKVKSRILFLLVLSVLLCSTVSAFAADKSIVIALASDALTLDPQRQQETITNALTQHVYEPLMTTTADGNTLVPLLAESWSVGADQITWTFQLRKGVTFSDGTPFTADDVQFTLERAKKGVIRDLVANIEKTEVVNASTMRVITKAPDAVLLNKLLQLPILSKVYITKVGDDTANIKPMGTGPYLCTEWVREDHISFVPNKSYWGKQAAIANVRYRPITNAPTRTAAFLGGEVDVVEDIPVRDVNRIKSASGLEVLPRPGRRLIYLHIDATRSPTPGINLPVNPMKDLRVRQAISLGLDRNAIVKVVMNGNGYPTGQLLLDGRRGSIPGLPQPEYNPEKAKQLLKEAGYEKGFTVTFDASNGRYANDAQIAQAIASQLAKIGITVNLMLHPKSVFLDYVRPGDKSSLVMTGWSEEVDFGVMGNVLFYTRGKNPAKGGSNRCHYSNPAFDKLLEDADKTADISKRTQFLEQAARVILDDVGVIPLFFHQDIYGKKANVHFEPRVDKQIRAYNIDIVE